MHKLDEGYKHKYNKKEMDRMFNIYKNNTYTCKCGHRISIPNDINKMCCHYCGCYVFKTKKDEFMFRIKEKMNNG